nr:reverse transcriptase domain-containing protein [Tanacetum cinerariifolium]
MAALVISISSDVSVESVGSSFPRVIIISSIFVEVLVAPEVGVAAVALPVGVLELDTHSSSEADLSESSPPLVSKAPMVSTFLCLDDSESDTEMPEKHVSPIPHDAMLTRALTTRKSVRPLPSHRLSLRYTSHHLDRFTSGSSSGHSSSDHSSFGHSILGHSLSGYASPDTTVADSSTLLKFVYPPLARTPRCSEAYLSCRFAPLSTMYTPTTSKSSAGDSSFESSVGPSRKRCRSPATTLTSSIHATRALVPYRADRLLPRKRFRDSLSPEDNVEEDIDADKLADIEVDATAIEVIVDKDVEAAVDACIGMEVDVGIDVEDEVEDEVESSDREDIKTKQRALKARSLIAGGERASLLEQVASLERSNARLRGTMMIESTRADRFQQRISFMEIELRQISLASYEVTRAANALEAESEIQNGYDNDNGNGENGNGVNGNPNENDRGARPVARECTYQDFMKCQSFNFKGMDRVVELIRWFGKMETVFYISNFPEKYQVKYATCTLLNSALTYWDLHKRTVGTEAAFAMS